MLSTAPAKMGLSSYSMEIGCENKTPASSRLSSKHSSPRLSIFLLLLAATSLLLGLFAALAAYRMQVVVVEISGSPPAPEMPPYLANLTVGGVSPINYITTSPAGEAFVSWRYASPRRVVEVVRWFPGTIDRTTVARAMSLQYRDETGLWIEALQASWSIDERLQHGHRHLVPAPHNIVAASEWRVVALAGGNGQIITIPWIDPTPSAGDAFDYFRNLNYEVLLAATVLAVGVPLALLFSYRGRIFFFLTCMAVLAAGNLIFFGITKPLLTWYPDSGSYWQWPPHPMRSPVFGPLLHLMVERLGFDGLHLLQFNLLLGSYLFALACLAKATRSYLILVPFAVLPLFWSNFALHASNVLTEPWFMAALLLMSTGLVGMILGGRYSMAALTGLGLVIAVVVKSVGIVLLAPALLAYRFLPGERHHRLLLMGMSTIPAVAVYLAMSFYGSQLNGRFSPQAGAGFVLAGHVAWLLDASHLDERYRSAGESVVAKAAEVYDRAPPITEPAAYVKFTSDNYNFALGDIIAPLMARRLLEVERIAGVTQQDVIWVTGRLPRSLYVKLNDILLAWSIASISANPMRYLTFCALHYWGLWRDGLDYYFTLGRASAQMMLRAEDLQQVMLGKRPWGIPEFESYYDRHREAVNSGALAVLQLKFFELPASPAKYDVAAALMILTLALSALYLVPVRFSPTISGLIVSSLLINAYLSGQALFQVSLVRYGEVIIPAVGLMLALGAVVLRDCIGGCLPILQGWLRRFRAVLQGRLRFRAVLQDRPRRFRAVLQDRLRRFRAALLEESGARDHRDRRELPVVKKH